jgi:transposase
VILFEDEGRFGRISQLRADWAPQGRRPLVPKQVVRESAYGFVAVAPLEGRLFWQVHPKCDTEAVNAFLLGLLEAFPDRRIVLFLDGAGWHRSKTLARPGRVRFELLPAYTPETNPVEHIWDEVREKHMANRLFATLDLVTQTLRNALETLSYNEMSIKSITCFSWIKKMGFLYL